MFKITVFIPHNHTERVLGPMFDAGAGRLGNYDQCCFMCEGEGQFRPLGGANAFIGKNGVLEKVKEMRVELLCPKLSLKNVIKALKESHPYEEPAFDVIELVDRSVYE